MSSPSRPPGAVPALIRAVRSFEAQPPPRRSPAIYNFLESAGGLPCLRLGGSASSGCAHTRPLHLLERCSRPLPLPRLPKPLKRFP